ncbi:hypothetical protein [Winogradskyella sp. KYW1333]|jgi:hypothetical protein|uniref:hypothetical protein n=1 Tax=unclassified Winogradskyella TaxID=2615021 RepID=UPI000DF398F4|nr:hypothetical protein [Winogradskyella sp. KYW1333]RCT56089.1 hypothetical protein DUZ96_01495 [Winogradskyella sp. KYW1333]
MKQKNLIIGLLLVGFISFSFINNEKSYAEVEYKVVTSVESIVPNGLGRSRLISSNVTRDYSEFTSERSSNKDEDGRNKSKRSEIRVKDFEETKLLNFFNLGGIRFQNIVANDAVISSKLITMAKDGWELAFVTSSSESDAGKGDGQGIFVTRYIFKRIAQ